MPQIFGLCLLVGAMMSFVACGSDGTTTATTVDGQGDGGATADAGTTATNQPTFHKDVAPIFFAKCASCHTTGGIGPFDITDPKVAKARAALIVSEIASGRMPPWSAKDTATCAPPKPWKNDARLSQSQKDTIAAWAKAGAPLGDAVDSAALKVSKPIALSRVDRSMKPKVGFIASGNKDQYICFPFDPKLDADSWIQGVRFIAGNALVAHHALLYLDPNGTAAKKAGKKGYYDGFGSCNVQGGLVAAWAPGGVPIELPKNSGIPIKKGSQLVMQMHYHPLGDAADEDKTIIELKLTTKAPRYEVIAALIGNAHTAKDGLQPGPNDNGKVEFRIPAGVENHTETIAWKMPLSYGASGVSHVRVLGVAAHMHYLGAGMRVWVKRRTKETMKGLCTSKDKGLLDPCVTGKCGGKKGKALTDCAVAKCTKELQSVDQKCVECLANELKNGAPDLWKNCVGDLTLPQGPADSDKDMCLVHTPKFAFNWQRFYMYDAAIESLPSLRPGDTLNMECTFNNSKSNKILMAALNEAGKTEPIDVKLGDETLDEMCLTGLYLLRDTTQKTGN